MSYITYEEVIARYPVIESWGRQAMDVSSDLIYYAEVEINGLLGTHFTVPFGGSHPTIKDLTIDLAYYRAALTKDGDKAERIRKRVMDRIAAIIAGKEAIYTDSGTILGMDTAAVPIWSNVDDYHPAFSMLDAESEYSHVSSAMLEDLEAERS